MTPQDAITHGAGQPIGYWGAAAIVTTVVVCGWFGRWMIKKFEELLEYLKASHAQQTEILVGVVVDNSRAMNALSAQMVAHTTEVHEVRVAVMKCPGPRRGNNEHND